MLFRSKILNAGAWSRSSEKVFVSLPTELEDLIPEVEDFYKKNHSGRKLHWHHLMSNGIVSDLPDSNSCSWPVVALCLEGAISLEMVWRRFMNAKLSTIIRLTIP